MPSDGLRDFGESIDDVLGQEPPSFRILDDLGQPWSARCTLATASSSQKVKNDMGLAPTLLGLH